MFTIGEFSKINRITTKTLRHYDKIGLLKPAEVDGWTGYRYYSPNQLETIHRILMLREMGFGLPEIAEFLKTENDRDGDLERREREIERAIGREQKRLEAVRKYRRRLRGEEPMESKIAIKPLPEVMAASMRTVVPGYDAYFDIVPKMGEYMRSVGAVCLEPAYCFTIYHDGEYRESDIDVEICEAVVEAREESDQVKFRTIPGAREAACLEHKGPYSTLRVTYNRLFRWIEEKGLETAGNPRESYIDGIWNRQDPEEWLTEVQVPLKNGEA